MNTLDLIFHFSVILMSLIIFFSKVTAENQIFALLFKAMGKLVPFFCMLYAGVKIFKHFGII